MLNRHPSIWLCDETNYFYKVYSRRRAFGDLREPAARRHLIDRLLETERIQGLKLPLDELRGALMKDGDSYKTFFTALIRFSASQNGKARFGEKTPGHALFADRLRDWYPDCRIIHIVRDPRDVAASFLRVPFGSNDVMVNARTWVGHVAAAERCRDRTNYMVLRFEDLVENPESELRRVLSFVGEPFDPAVLVPTGKSEDVPWWKHRAQSEVDRGRVGRWRQELSEKQIALIESVAGRRMKDHGYELSGKRVSAMAVAGARLGEGFHHVWNRATHLKSLWYFWIQPTDLAADERSWVGRTN